MADLLGDLQIDRASGLEIVGLYSNAVALDRTMMFSTPSGSTMLDTRIRC